MRTSACGLSCVGVCLLSHHQPHEYDDTAADVFWTLHLRVCTAMCCCTVISDGILCLIPSAIYTHSSLQSQKGCSIDSPQAAAVDSVVLALSGHRITTSAAGGLRISGTDVHARILHVRIQMNLGCFHLNMCICLCDVTLYFKHPLLPSRTQHVC